MLPRLIVPILAILVSNIHCDVSHLPFRTYGAPSATYGAPHDTYGAPLFKRQDGFQSQSFEDFFKSQNTVSVTPPPASLRLPETSTSVDFLSPFSTTEKTFESSTSTPIAKQQTVEQSKAALPAVNVKIESSDKQAIGGSTINIPQGGFGSSNIDLTPTAFSATNVPQNELRVTPTAFGFGAGSPQNGFGDLSSVSFKSEVNFPQTTFGGSNLDLTAFKTGVPLQQETFTNLNIPQHQQEFNFNLPTQQSHFGFDQSFVSSTTPSGIDYSAFSTPKPIISEYSNIGIHSPVFNTPTVNTQNLLNADAALNSGLSFLGKTSGGSLTDAFGVPSSTISPLEESIASLPPVSISQQPQQNYEVSKNLYFFAAPEEPEEQAQPRVHLPTAPPKKNYKIIFIKAPEFKPAAPVSIPATPQNEEKTLIYVLQKKPSAPGDIEVQTPPPTAPAKPEVFFIKYKNEKDAQEAVSQVQEAHAAGQVVDNQELLNRFGQKNALIPQSYENSNEYQQILSQFGSSTPSPVTVGSTFSSIFPSFATSTVSPLPSFKSNVAPLAGLGNFQFNQNLFGTSTPSPLIGNAGFKSFETVPSSVAPTFGSFNSFEASTPSPLNVGSLGLGSEPSLGLRGGFESFSTTASPQFNAFESSTPSSVGFKSFESVPNAAPTLTNFNLGQSSFESSPSTSFPGFKSFEGVNSNVHPSLTNFNLGQTSFESSTPSSLGFESSTPSSLGYKTFGGVSSNVAPAFGGFNTFQSSPQSSLGFKSFDNVAPSVGSFNIGQNSFVSTTPSPLGSFNFESSTPSSLGYKSFEGVSSTVAPAQGSFNIFESSTPSPLSGLSASSFGGVQNVEQRLGDSTIDIVGNKNEAVVGEKTVEVQKIVDEDVSTVSSTPSSVLAGETQQEEKAVETNEVEDSNEKTETASASSRHEVYGPPKE